MKKKFIIKKHDDFTRIIRTGKYIKTNYFILYNKVNDENNYRFGISVSKKVGNAVLRNKIKRHMRMIINDYKNNYQKNMDYIIIIRCNYVEATYSEIKTAFENAIDRVNKYMNNKEKCNEIK